MKARGQEVKSGKQSMVRDFLNVFFKGTGVGSKGSHLAQRSYGFEGKAVPINEWEKDNW